MCKNFFQNNSHFIVHMHILFLSLHFFFPSLSSAFGKSSQQLSRGYILRNFRDNDIFLQFNNVGIV